MIAIGVVMVQPFLTAGAPDPSARICIVAFSVAIPLLAALVLLNRQEVFRRRRARSVPVAIAEVVAQVCAFVGVVAGFWHILWIAGGGNAGRWARGGSGPHGGLHAPGTRSAKAPGRRRTRRHTES